MNGGSVRVGSGRVGSTRIDYSGRSNIDVFDAHVKVITSIIASLFYLAWKPRSLSSVSSTPSSPSRKNSALVCSPPEKEERGGQKGGGAGKTSPGKPGAGWRIIRAGVDAGRLKYFPPTLIHGGVYHTRHDSSYLPHFFASQGILKPEHARHHAATGRTRRRRPVTSTSEK